MIKVKHVARLANLQLSEKELQIYSKQLGQILEYIDKLAEVKTNKIKPTFQTLDDTVNVFRQDKITPSLTQKQALSQAAKVHQGYFVADHVFSQKSSSTTRKSTSRKKLDQYNAVLTQVDPKGNLGNKDLFCTLNIETTAGSAVLNGFRPQYSATVVNQLGKLGFKTKFKLNQDAWGHGSSGENSDFGPTKNPWNTDYVPGGSSSGSGVTVSIDKVELATATDTCGSIRLPASFCNLSGIKPTYGALSRYGVIAFASSLDCPGFLARSVKQLRQVFTKLSQSDSFDATSQSSARNKSVNSEAKTIGIPEQYFQKGIDPEVRQKVLAAAKLLEKHGFKTKSVSLPHSQYGVAAYYIIAPTETSSNLSRYDGVRFGNDRSYFGQEAKRRIMLGTFASSAGYADKYYEQAAKIRTLIINDFNHVFKSVDAVLAPTSPTPPFKLGEKTADPLTMYLSDIYAAPSSLAGLPSLAIPCGFTKTSLPIGLQLIGPRWSEPRLFKLGEKYQRLTDWHLQKPKL